MAQQGNCSCLANMKMILGCGRNRLKHVLALRPTASFPGAVSAIPTEACSANRRMKHGRQPDDVGCGNGCHSQLDRRMEERAPEGDPEAVQNRHTNWM
jgi:hypothetical protein